MNMNQSNPITAHETGGKHEDSLSRNDGENGFLVSKSAPLPIQIMEYDQSLWSLLHECDIKDHKAAK